jgi:predicted transcriptional regulator
MGSVWWYGSGMAQPKATFSLDDETLASLKRSAARTGKPQSLIVREAIAQYEANADRLTASERRHALGVVAEIRRQGRTASAKAVKAEIAGVRQARRQGGRASRPE